MIAKVWIGVPAAAIACLLAVAALAPPPHGGRAGRGRGRWAKPPVKVGEAVPDFALKDVEGNTVKPADFKGKSILVLEFGACT